MSEVKEMDQFTTQVFELKRKMLAEGVRRAEVRCQCGGVLVAVLAGRNNHVHAMCQQCSRGVMQ